MDLGITGRTAIVAASSKGIGRATAETLAREGVNVVLCAREEETLRRAEQELAEIAGADRVLAVPTDVGDAAAVARLVDATRERFGPVGILVASTGGPPPRSFLDTSDEDWRRVLDGVVLSAVRLVRAVVPDMQSVGWGRIVFLTSTAAKQPLQHLVLSNATRPGLHGLAKTLSQELAADGITVNCLLPGVVEGTRAAEILEHKKQKSGASEDQVEAEVRAMLPLGRMGYSREIADAITFLVSERASYITGVSLSVDGGLAKSTF